MRRLRSVGRDEIRQTRAAGSVDSHHKPRLLWLPKTYECTARNDLDVRGIGSGMVLQFECVSDQRVLAKSADLTQQHLRQCGSNIEV
jgi:hypothetical protein